ncbi:hypothetical protein FB451DRAFT_1180526 [Mycena latifolia]|nr:hypothetical protein FB451DRAFT_1180526 [Mycena latifolia]
MVMMSSFYSARQVSFRKIKNTQVFWEWIRFLRNIYAGCMLPPNFRTGQGNLENRKGRVMMKRRGDSRLFFLLSPVTAVKTISFGLGEFWWVQCERQQAGGVPTPQGAPHVRVDAHAQRAPHQCAPPRVKSHVVGPPREAGGEGPDTRYWVPPDSSVRGAGRRAIERDRWREVQPHIQEREVYPGGEGVQGGGTAARRHEWCGNGKGPPWRGQEKLTQ